MKTSKITIYAAALGILSASLITSCQKDSPSNPANPGGGSADSETTSAADNAYVENMSNDMDNIGDQAGNTNGGSNLTTYRQGGGQNSILSTCATVSVHDLIPADPDTLLVDFGNTNCVCSDGKVRNGMIRYVYSAGHHYRDSGIVITVTPVNYSVDSYQISGTKSITNRGRISGSNFTWDITANFTVIKPNNGGTITWNCSRTKILLNTSAVYNGALFPINWAQAKIGLTGNASGTTAAGGTYTANITQMLVRDMTCSPSLSHPHWHPIIQGTIVFTPSGHLARTIDFGNGACDLTATVTIAGVSFNITL
jgi:hypothetical protein